MYQGAQMPTQYQGAQMDLTQCNNYHDVGLFDDPTYESDLANTGRDSEKEKITPEYVWQKYLSTKKNPIMILNEFCSRFRKTPEFRVDNVNAGRSKIFYTTIEVEGLGVLVDREPGKNKQSSKTNASHKAVEELININQKAREIVLEQSKRALGEISVKDKYGQKIREKREKNKEEKRETMLKLRPDFQRNPNAFTTADPYDQNFDARQGPNLLYEQFLANNNIPQQNLMDPNSIEFQNFTNQMPQQMMAIQANQPMQMNVNNMHPQNSLTEDTGKNQEIAQNQINNDYILKPNPNEIYLEQLKKKNPTATPQNNGFNLIPLNQDDLAYPEDMKVDEDYGGGCLQITVDVEHLNGFNSNNIIQPYGEAHPQFKDRKVKTIEINPDLPQNEFNDKDIDLHQATVDIVPKLDNYEILEDTESNQKNLESAIDDLSNVQLPNIHKIRTSDIEMTEDYNDMVFIIPDEEYVDNAEAHNQILKEFDQPQTPVSQQFIEPPPTPGSLHMKETDESISNRFREPLTPFGIEDTPNPNGPLQFCEPITPFMQTLDKNDPNVQSKSNNENRNESMDNEKTYTIKDLMGDEGKILLVLNAFSQKRHQNPKWDVKTENGLSVADQTVGGFNAQAMHRSKKTAKLNAGRKILRQIESDEMQKEIFENFMKTLKDQELSLTANELKAGTVGELAIEDQNPGFFIKANDIGEWFEELNKKLEPKNISKKELTSIFEYVDKIAANAVPKMTIRLCPIGSFLNGSYRASKLEADCICVSSSEKPIMLELLEVKLNEILNKKKENSKSRANDYNIGPLVHVDPWTQRVAIIHTPTSIKINIYKFLDEENKTYTNNDGKLINKNNSFLYHSIWIEECLAKNAVSEQIVNIMRIVREWKDINNLKACTELFDQAIYYCTFNFTENDIMKALLKFFALQNLLINKYNFYFYELSEYHSYLIQNLDDDTRNAIIKKSQETFLKLSKRNPADFY